jgi:hypothetical protein
MTGFIRSSVSGGGAGPDGLQGLNTGDETGARLATLHHAANSKTPVDADEVAGGDSAAGFGLIRSTWTAIKAFLKTYNDTLYVPQTTTVNGHALNANVTVTKSDVGLASVDNTADSAKPVSTAQAAADAQVLVDAKAYTDAAVVGLYDPRGNFDASGNVFPSTGGSGAAGAVLKSDIWRISVAGTLGGEAVGVGDEVVALVDAPGQTAANWNIYEHNVGYVPEPQQTAVSQAEAEAGTGTSVRSWTPQRVWQSIAAALTLGTWISGATNKATPVDADTFPGSDSAASGALKKFTWANIKAALKTYTDTLYPSGSGTSSGANTGDETAARLATINHAAAAKTVLVDADEVVGSNSASSFSLIRTVWSDVWTYIKSKADTFYQPVDTDLTALAGLATAANKVPYFTGAAAAALADFTAQARIFTALTTVAAQRVGLGLDALTGPLMNWYGKNFNGTTSYLNASPMTGAVDGKAGSIVLVVRFALASGAAEILVFALGNKFFVQRTAGGNIQVAAANAAGSTILTMDAASAATAAGTYVIMASWDLATAGSGRLYINDVSNNVASVYTNDTIDYTVAQWGIGAFAAGGSYFNGDFYELWFDPTQRLEFNTASVRRKFTDANNVPLFLGCAGELPTGSAPGEFHAYDDVIGWKRNRGTFTGAWTENGTVATASTQLQGQYATVGTIGIPVTVTAAYTLSEQDTVVISNRAATNPLTLPSAVGRTGREIRVIGQTAFTVTSASSNVVPLAGGAAGTAILPAVAGSTALLKSNGVAWQIVDI